MDVGETYTPMGKLTTFRYLISLIARYGSNIDHLNVVTAFVIPEIGDDIYKPFPEGLPEGLNTPKIIVTLRKALYSLKQAPRLWQDNINAILISLRFTLFSADPNLHFRGNSILILLFDDNISTSYCEATA